MIKILAILELLLNLYAFQYSLNPIAFLVISFIIYFFIYFIQSNSNKKNSSYIFLELMIFSLPYSWTNIFGQPITEMPITWFYIFGFLYFISIVVNKKDFIIKKEPLNVIFLILILISFIPLLFSHDLKEGLSDFLMSIFFTLLSFVSYNKISQIETYDLKNLIKDYIFINFISAIVIIFQYLMYQFTGQIFFKMNIEGTFAVSKLQVGGLLLFEDASSATIMLACGVLLALIESNKNKTNLLYALIILTGLAFTARRTGAIALLLILPIYFFINYKGIKKFLYIFLMILLGLLLIRLLTLSRPVDNTAQLFDDNNRIADYFKALDIAINNPLGVGFGDTYIASLTGHTIPHNTILRWLDIGGILYAIPMLYILLKSLFISFRKNKTLFWPILCSILAMNFIPDLLNARFIVILVCLSFLYKDGGLNEEQI